MSRLWTPPKANVSQAYPAPGWEWVWKDLVFAQVGSWSTHGHFVRFENGAKVGWYPPYGEVLESPTVEAMVRYPLGSMVNMDGYAFTIVTILRITAWDNYANFINVPFHDSATWSGPYKAISQHRDSGNDTFRAIWYAWGTGATDYDDTNSNVGAVAADGEWRFLGGVRSFGNAWAYLDGEPWGSETGQSASPIHWGDKRDVVLMNRHYQAEGEGMAGHMAFSAIWNRAFSPAEMKALYQNPFAAFQRPTHAALASSPYPLPIGDEIDLRWDVEAAPSIITNVSPSEFDYDETSITISSSTADFGSTQGAGSVYISDAPNLTGSPSETDVGTAITSWNASTITLDLSLLNSAAASDLSEETGPGSRYVIVVTDATTEGEYAVTTHRAAAFSLYEFGGIPPSGASVPPQLIPPNGKIFTDFGGGRIQDDENPGDLVDIGRDEYREDSWAISPTSHVVVDRTYEFRAYYDGNPPLNVYTHPYATVHTAQAGTVGKDLNVRWDTLTEVGDPIDIQWQTYGNATKTVGFVWTTFREVTDTLQLVWQQLEAVAGVGSAWGWPWGDPGIALRWDINPGAVGKDIQLLWDNLAFIGDTVDLQWDIFTEIGDTVQALWDIFTEIGDTVDLQWALSAPIGDAVQALWDILDPIGDTVQVLWDIEAFGTVDKELQLVWQAREFIGDTVQALWDIFITAADEIDLQWAQTQLAADEFQALWDIVGVVGDDSQLVWQTRAITGDESQLIWAIAGVAGQEVEFDWEVFAPIGDTVQTIWQTRSLIGDTVQALWDITGAAGRYVTVIWEVAGSVGKALQALWDVAFEKYYALLALNRVTGAASAPVYTPVTAANTRASTSDNPDPAYNYSIRVPNPGQEVHSYWITLQLETLNSPSTSISNVRLYSDGLISWPGVEVKVALADTYIQATGREGITGDELNATNHSGLATNPVPLERYNEEAPLSLDATTTTAEKFGEYIVLQVTGTNDAMSGPLLPEVLQIEWEDA